MSLKAVAKIKKTSSYMIPDKSYLTDFSKTRAIVEHTIKKVVGESCETPEEAALIGKQVCDSMEEFKAQDCYESLAISQLLIIYHSAMEAFRLSHITINRTSLGVYERLQNQGMKLMRLYCTQVDSLQKYRARNDQKLKVEHVHVHKGGQAIVGPVEKRKHG